VLSNSGKYLKNHVRAASLYARAFLPLFIILYFSLYVSVTQHEIADAGQAPIRTYVRLQTKLLRLSFKHFTEIKWLI